MAEDIEVPPTPVTDEEFDALPRLDLGELPQPMCPGAAAPRSEELMELCVQLVNGLSCAYPLDEHYRCARNRSHDVVTVPFEPPPAVLDGIAKRYPDDSEVQQLLLAYRDAREDADRALGDRIERDEHR